MLPFFQYKQFDKNTRQDFGQSLRRSHTKTYLITVLKKIRHGIFVIPFYRVFFGIHGNSVYILPKSSEQFGILNKYLEALIQIFIKTT